MVQDFNNKSAFDASSSLKFFAIPFADNNKFKF